MSMLPKALAPRLLIATLALTLTLVCAVTLALFANTGIIVKRFLDESVELRRVNLQREMQSRASQATAGLEREIDELIRDSRLSQVQRSLDESTREIRDIQYVLVLDPNGQIIASAGEALPSAPAFREPQDLWGDTQLSVVRNITLAGANLGQLQTAFSLADFNRQIEGFRSELLEARRDYRRSATMWVVLTALFMVIGCAAIAWLTAIRLVAPINAITRQAERMRLGDYGEPVRARRDDELGKLANAFNAMRDQLRQTTISRDYVDNVLSSMNDAVIVTAEDGAITHCNEAALRLTGFTETQLLGMPVSTLVTPAGREKFVNTEPSGQPREAHFLTADGSDIPVSWTCSKIETDDPLLGGRIYTAQNITERKRSEQRIRYLARIDPLTKVPNRMQFQHLLQRSIARARRDKSTLALFYVDVDQFKDINDTFGHLAGDTTLEVLTRRMTESLAQSVVIGRLAGDEFAAFLDDLPAVEDMQDSLRGLGRDLLANIAEPIDVQGHEVFVTASLGIAIYPQDADNVIDLIRNADAALYASKRAGGNRVSFYDPQMNEAAVERLMMKSRLRRSFERDELLLHYQPKYELCSGRMVGAEALVRWDMPDRGRIQPNEFIPLAEQTNLIIEIGEWVIEKVCSDIEKWNKLVGDPGRIAINLSLKQLRQKNFFNSINRIFTRYGIKPSDIEFEITETTLMEEVPRTIEVLDKLRAFGLQLAIDDFGTGYSSLSALQKFPIKTLKIDRSFVTNAASDENDAAIVTAIIHMSRSLKLEVVAEGVETEAQLRFLRRLRCDYVQGMLFGEPMVAEQYGERLLGQLDGTDQHKALFG